MNALQNRVANLMLSHEKAVAWSVRQQYQGHNLTAGTNCSILTNGELCQGKGRGAGDLVSSTHLWSHFYLLTIELDATEKRAVTHHTDQEY